MWCATCRQVNALGGAPLKLTGWRGLWIAVQAVGARGSVRAEEVAEVPDREGSRRQKPPETRRRGGSQA